MSDSEESRVEITRVPSRASDALESETMSQTPLDVTQQWRAINAETVKEFEALFSDYEILDEVARGGMGVVYRARQRSLDRTVALKMILSGQFASASDVKRFQTEARAAAQLDHLGIVPIYDIGEQGGRHFYTMAFVEGSSLQQRLKAGPMPAAVAAELLVKVAEAVDFAHEKGIIHRDLKPHNILLDRMGNPKVADFGLAKSLSLDEGLTASGDILGTPSYMAPEQAAGKTGDADRAVDIYALGAILYCLLTGRPPFQAATLAETLNQVIHTEPVSPRLLNPSVPRDLETLCLRCLQKNPQQRYGTAEELAADLRRFLSGEPIHARPVGAPERLVRWVRRKPIAAMLIAVSLGSIITIVTLVLVSNARLQSKTLYAEGQTELAKQNAKKAEAQTLVAQKQTKLALERGLSDRRRAYAASMPLAFQSAKDFRMDRLLPRLEQERPKSDEVDVRGFEWYYLWQLCHQERATLVGHKGTVNCVAYSGDGQLLASGSDDKTIRLWNPHTGQSRVLQSEGPVYTMVFLPGTDLLATGSCGIYTTSTDLGVRLWNTKTGQLQQRLETTHGVRALAVSTDGKLLAATHDSSITVWETASFAPLWTFKAHEGWIAGLAFAPDGSYLASGGFDQNVKLWNVAEKKEVAVMKHGPAHLHALAFSPDSKTIVTGSAGYELNWWNVEKRELIRSSKAGERFAVAFTRDGSRVVTSSSIFIDPWDAATGADAGVLIGHVGEIRCLAISKESVIASGAQDGMVKLWDMPEDSGLKQAKGTVRLSPTPDGKSLYRVGSDRIEKWRLSDEFLEETVAKDLPLVSSSAVSPDGRQIALAQESGLSVFDTATRKSTVLTPEKGITSLEFSPDGKLLAAGCAQINTKSDVKVWDVASKQLLHTFKDHEWDARALAFSPDGKKLAVASWYVYFNIACKVYVWDIGAHRRVELEGQTKSVTDVNFSPDGKLLASTSVDGIVKVWDVEKMAVAATLDGHNAGVTSVRFANREPRLFTGDENGTIIIWDLVTRQEVGRLQDKKIPIGKLVLTPQDDMLISSSDSIDPKTDRIDHKTGSVTCWPARTGRYPPAPAPGVKAAAIKDT